MLGIVIGIITEGLTGQGIAHQIGLGPLVMATPLAIPSSCPSVTNSPSGIGSSFIELPIPKAFAYWSRPTPPQAS
jgi:hypothetical protein